MNGFEKVVGAFEKMKEFDVGETVEELNAKMIQGLSTKPVGNPEKCMICEENRDSYPEWEDSDWLDHLTGYMWTGEGWTCPYCSGEYMDLLDVSEC
jgi:hypothetical protein